MDLKPWTVLFVVAIGNCGFWLFLFNRVNATGLTRRWSKFFERLFISLCFLIPLAIGFIELDALWQWLTGSGDWWPDAFGFRLYGAWCCAACVVLGVPWLESRRWIIPPSNLLSTNESRSNVDQSLPGGSAGDRTTRLLCRLPGNEIGEINANTKQLKLPRKIGGAEGIRIGHLSDLHFTGHMRKEHYQYVFDRLHELEPDLIVVSGDIIDYDKCMEWLEPVCGRLKAPYGVYFVLGNHDCRVSSIEEVSARLVGCGMHDLGKSPSQVSIRKTLVRLVGNERPWLHRNVSNPLAIRGAAHEEAGSEGPVSSSADEESVDHGNIDNGSVDEENVLRLAVSHSPDQITWARENRFDLMLAGHTHGGQVRLPLLGPIVSPSSYGSRYASGVFYLEPTLMHVSRGVSGTHALRWRCCPEVSVLVLRNA